MDHAAKLTTERDNSDSKELKTYTYFSSPKVIYLYLFFSIHAYESLSFIPQGSNGENKKLTLHSNSFIYIYSATTSSIFHSLSSRFG